MQLNEGLLTFYEPIPSDFFHTETASKVNGFLERKLKSSLPVLQKLGKEKYSLYGISKKQMQFLLPTTIFLKLMEFEPSAKLFLSETIFIFRYKKNSQIEFSIGRKGAAKH